MAPVTPVPPKFPGGRELAPEITAGGTCAHSACSCPGEAGQTYCCRACARAPDEAEACPCGHYGCTARTV